MTDTETTTARWDDAFLDATIAVTSLRNRVRVNAVFSIVSGVGIVIAAPWLGDQLGTDRHGVIRAAGVLLVLYGDYLFVAASARWRRLRSMAPGIVGGDYLWVAGTLAALATGAIDRAAGMAVVAATGLVVAAFAVSQHRALSMARRIEAGLGADADLAPPVEAIRIERPSTVDTDRLWSAVEDHELFGTLAHNLDRVEVVSGEGTDLVRRCVANNGEAWTEQCTIWEPGRRHAVEVDTGDYPYPLQLVACLSYVESAPRHPAHTSAGLVFQTQARPGFAGQAAMIVLHAGRPVLARVVRGWTTAAADRKGVVA